ncbi:MAG: nitroreductase family deazaflavin-dependent oxidoreductase [Acidimicrobiales bacterium]
MPLPHLIARFNKRVTNRFIEPIARRSSGFAVVHHVGRRSRTAYSTPVNLFELDGDAIVALTYGSSADWLRNVLAGGGTVENVSGWRPIDSAVIVDRAVAWPALPRPVKGALRILGVHQFLRLSFDAEAEHGEAEQAGPSMQG